jgi:serine/threonine protein kinase/WD40 repeat protein
MTDDPRVREILDHAADLPPAERSAYLETACAGDPALRAEVESLLAALEDADEFLVSPAGSPRVEEAPVNDSLGTMIGHYKLIEKIGEGGMGVVYKADQSQPVHRQVALKIIKPGMDTSAVIGRFEAERRALALMDHSNIARVLDAGSTENGRPYFVMELVTGVSITRYCDEHRLTPEQRLELFIPVCRAVEHAHQKGIIHRDLKPSNILVTEQDGKAIVKVIDFGIARAIEQTDAERTAFTQAGMLVGTPEYMSPEQAGGRQQETDTRSDIYALGVILYELLTGATPLDRKQLYTAGYEQMMRTIREVQPPKPSTRLSTLGEGVASTSALRRMDPRKLARLLLGDLDLIVMKCLEKDRARRYETASGLARDVERFLNGDPVEATPPSPFYIFGKFALKYRKALAVAAAFAVVLVGCLITTSVVFWVWKTEALHERDIARAAEAKADAARIREQKAKDQEIHQTLIAQQQRQLADQQTQAAEEQRRISSAQTELAQTRAYYAAISAASGAVNLDNLGAANFFLSLAPSNMINWEWNYLHAAANLQLATVRFNSIDRVYYFPDLNDIVEFDGDRSVNFLDPRTRKLKRRVLTIQASGLWPCAISSDEQRFVATEVGGDNPGRLHVLGPQGEPIALIEKSVQSNTYRYTTTFTKDHRKFITAAYPDDKIKPPQADHPLRVWETDTGRLLKQIDIQTSPLCNAAFNADDSLLVTGSTDGVSQVWEMASGKCVSTWSDSVRDAVSSTFSPDGDRILTTSRSLNKLAVIWKPTSPNGTVTRVIPETDHVTDAICGEFSPDGKMIALSGGRFAAIFNTDVKTELDEKPVAVFSGQNSRIPQITFVENGTRVFTSGNDNSIWFWDIPPRTNPLIFGGKGSARVTDAQFAVDGQSIITRRNDGIVQTYGLGTGRLLYTLDPEVLRTRTPIEKQTFDPAIPRLAVPCPDGTVQVCDARTGELLERIGDARPGEFPVVTGFTHDGKHAITGSARGAVRVWDLTGATPRFSLCDSGPAVEKIVISPTDDRAISVAHGGYGRLWDLHTGQFKSDFGGPSVGFVFNHKGTRISAGQGVSTMFFDINGVPEHGWIYSHWSNALAISFSADDSKVLTTYDDTVVELRESQPHGRVFMTTQGHQGAVIGCCFSPDESRVLTCSVDGTADLWETRTGSLLLALQGHTRPLTKAEFSPDGTRILTVSQDGTARAWDSVSTEQRMQQTR